MTTDTHLAAIAPAHDAVLVSFDSDFARFSGLRWENPASIPAPRAIESPPRS
jgi:predicted nucleic acid-binding protein